MKKQFQESHRSALRIVLLYAVFAGLWIYFTDNLIGALVRNPDLYVRLSVYKGFLFIAVTGTFLYFLIASDIRRMRTIASALVESDVRFRSYVENAPIAIMVFDAEGRCVDHNRAAVALTGADPALMRRLRLSDVLPQEAPSQPAGAGDEFESTRADGGRIWVQMRVVRLDGNKSLVFGQDISERVSAEERLRETNERLVQAEKMEAVGRLAGGVAHDFNNILTAIYGYSDVLLGSLPPGAEANGFVKEIRKAATRAASLTQRLLAFSRRQALMPRVVDTNELLRNLGPMLARLIGEDVEVSFDLDARPWMVRADPARIEQALINLAVNARDAMPRGGRLTLSTRNVRGGNGSPAIAGVKEGEYVAISVTDTGVGMDAQTKSHMFEPFFTTKEVGKGTGLGLATVYGIVTQSGGSITLRSEPGRGTTFTLYLPRAREEKADDGPQTQGRAAAGDGHELILYAEDDEAVRRLVTLILQKRGYEVLTASNGEEALHVAGPVIDRIALVIADVVMPRMNGRELVDSLRKTRGDLKCLYTSGYTADILAQHDIEKSGAVLLEKPIDSEVLLAKVREIIDAPPG